MMWCQKSLMSENRLKQGSSEKDLMLTACNNRRVKAYVGLPWWLRGKESTCQAGDADLIPGSGRSPEAGNDNPFQYSRQRSLVGCRPRGSERVRQDLVTEQHHHQQWKLIWFLSAFNLLLWTTKKQEHWRFIHVHSESRCENSFDRKRLGEGRSQPETLKGQSFPLPEVPWELLSPLSQAAGQSIDCGCRCCGGPGV